MLGQLLNLVFDNALDLTPFFLGGLGITLPPLWVSYFILTSFGIKEPIIIQVLHSGALHEDQHGSH